MSLQIFGSKRSKVKVKVTVKVKNTFSVISRLLVDIERSNWAQKFQKGRGFHLKGVVMPYEVCGALAVGTENLICAKMVIFRQIYVIFIGVIVSNFMRKLLNGFCSNFQEVVHRS